MTEDERKMQEKKIQLMEAALMLGVLWGIGVFALLFVIAIHTAHP